MVRFTEAEIVEVWEGRQSGKGNRSIGRRLDRSASSIRAFVESSGGVRPPVRHRSSRHLSLTEREEISRGIAAGESLAVIAGQLGRVVSTISRELARNGGRHQYRAHRAGRPQSSKLATYEQLRQVVEEKLAIRWSPQQISDWGLLSESACDSQLEGF